MERAMPKIDTSQITPRLGSGYPAPFKDVVAGREKYALGNAAGLTQFGVNLTRLKPGAASSVRHWHENGNEFVYILKGECVLVEDEHFAFCTNRVSRTDNQFLPTTLAWPGRKLPRRIASCRVSLACCCSCGT